MSVLTNWLVIAFRVWRYLWLRPCQPPAPSARRKCAGAGTVFEITDSGFVSFFAGTPGLSSCRDQTFAVLAKSFGEPAAASGALNYTGVEALQDAIGDFCE
jgi:hypothetical protein